MPNWNGHYCRCREVLYDHREPPPIEKQQSLSDEIEPWLSALIQSEHLSLLVGNGLTRATAFGLGATAPSMDEVKFDCELEEKVNAHAKRTAEASGRGIKNIEDQLRSAQSLIEGLRISEADEKGEPGPQTKKWMTAYNKAITDLIASVISTEQGIAAKHREYGGGDPSGLLNFLLSFASRPPTRERLELFTINYDRLIEHACDHLGIRLLDRFVGTINPQFRASRVNVDLHFDPPGIRGEPRYLEGVARLTKLHGSLDWRLDDQNVTRIALPFGPPDKFPTLADDPYRQVMIYPNAAKDVETLAFPYAELFRDFAAAVCRPNATLFVFGYSFGDDHINRIIRDMLSISSTHLVVMSWDSCGGAEEDKDKPTPYVEGRLERFCRKAGHEDQITLLIGKHFADLNTLTKRYLPRTLVEPIRKREADVRESRPHDTQKPNTSTSACASGGVSHDNAS